MEAATQSVVGTKRRNLAINHSRGWEPDKEKKLTFYACSKHFVACFTCTFGAVSKGTNEKLNSLPPLRASSSGNSSAEQEENAGSSPGTGGEKPPEDNNGGSTESGENESPSTGGENTDSEGSEESELPSSSTLEEFEEAIKRACSPSVRSSLFDKVGSSVSNPTRWHDQSGEHNDWHRKAQHNNIHTHWLCCAFLKDLFKAAVLSFYEKMCFPTIACDVPSPRRSPAQWNRWISG